MNGTIVKRPRKNGEPSWGYSFFAGRGENGKRLQITKSGFDTKKAASEALRAAIAAHEAGPEAAPSVPKTFGEWLEEWLSEYASRRCTPKTLERYKELAAYILPKVGSVPLPTLSALQLERAYNLLRDAGGKNGRPLSAKTVHHIAGVVRAALEKALALELIAKNPAKLAELPTLEKGEKAIVEQNQFEQLLEATRPYWPLSAFIQVAIATGLRRGELLALTWTEFDPAQRTLRILRSLEQTRHGLRLKCPKSRQTRMVRLAPSTVIVIEGVRARQKEFRERFGADYRQDLDLIFGNEAGEYLKPDSVTAKVCVLAKRAGLDGVSLHTLRHTHGSQLLSLGVPLPTVSKRLGHASTNITAEVYAHALSADEVAAADRWDSLHRVSTTDGIQ